MKKLITIYAVTTVLALLCLGGGPAFAEWTVVNLHPAGADWWPDTSYASGVSGGQQVGWWFIINYPHAGLWNGTAGSWVDLNPAGALKSNAFGVSGGQQVGVAYLDSSLGYWAYHAGLWSGSSGSWVDLNPGVGESFAYGVSGDHQVGVANGHAALWSGSAASWVDLDPAYSVGSCARGVSDGQQVGYANVYDTEHTGGIVRTHAGLWSGTATSWVDLSPVESTSSSSSSAYGVSGGQQVGFAQVGGVMHASLWNGTAESWVDLNPAGAEYSYAYGVSGGQQVGYARFFDDPWTVSRAVLWSGTAGSWVDLHALLPAAFRPAGAPGGQSTATSVDVSADEIWVVGSAYNSSTNRTEAILWHYTDESVLTPVEQIQQILDYTEDSVVDGTLEGVGTGKSADKKLGALVNMLEVAGYLIISENYDIACDQLTDALAKCDGQSPPPDFVEGDAAGDLATMIQELITELCEML